jgi:hypothetical protein
MKSHLYKITIATVITFSGASAAAEESGWKMPNLNPFSGKSAASNPATSGWKIPRLWPKTAAARKRRTNQSSALGTMTKGTRDFFSKTADAINPWDDKPAAQPQVTGSNSIFTRQSQAAKNKESKSSGVLPASWWGGDKDDDRDRSVNEFLSRPRP